jgi:uncharacterized membrane protein
VSDETSQIPQNGSGQSTSTDDENATNDVAVVSPKELQEKLTQRLQPLLRTEKVGELLMNVRQAVVETTTTVHHGPIPPPDQFREYNAILPGSADRILAMAEKEQNHRHAWERSHLNWDGFINVLSLSLGGLLSLALAGGAVYCASIHEPWVAGTLTGFSAFGAVASFLQGKRLFGKADHQVPSQLPRPARQSRPKPKNKPR